MEDNSSAVLAELVVQSFATKRFFNGRTWQDDYVAIPVPANSLSSNITSWNMDLEVFTETQNNLDFLVTRAIPTDDSMRTGPIDFTVNSLEDHSIFAAINPTIARKTFQTSTQVINGALGRFPNQRVNLSIVDTDSFRFFNGGFER